MTSTPSADRVLAGRYRIDGRIGRGGVGRSSREAAHCRGSPRSIAPSARPRTWPSLTDDELDVLLGNVAALMEAGNETAALRLMEEGLARAPASSSTELDLR